MSTTTTPPPAIQRNRPTDATGWFWAFVLLLAGLFYSHIWPVIGGLLLLASPLCFVRQFVKWRNDAAINRQATAWCRNYYASYGGTPVVDFMVAIVHDTGCDLNHVTPTTLLDELDGIPDDEEDFAGEGDDSDRHRLWLSDLLDDASIRDVDPSDFDGSTLHDAVGFVITCDKTG